MFRGTEDYHRDMTDVERNAIQGRALLLYDGVCALCNGVVQFLMKHDRLDRFRYAPLESSLGREVLAVPGSVFSPQSVGAHQLLRDGAGLVQNARDVLAALGRGQEVLDDPLQPPRRLGLASPGHRDGLLAHLSETLPMTAGDIARKLGLGFAEALANRQSRSEKLVEQRAPHLTLGKRGVQVRGQKENARDAARALADSVGV